MNFKHSQIKIIVEWHPLILFCNFYDRMPLVKTRGRIISLKKQLTATPNKGVHRKNTSVAKEQALAPPPEKFCAKYERDDYKK